MFFIEDADLDSYTLRGTLWWIYIYTQETKKLK
jgi:hypothetical protein